MVRLILTILSFQLLAGAAKAELLPFRAWRALKVTEAQARINDLSTPSEPAMARLSAKRAYPAQKLGRAKLILPSAALPGQSPVNSKENAKIALEVAQELGINDYFQLYIMPRASTATFYELAHKLTPEEMAALLESYNRSLQSGVSRGVSAAK